MLINVKIIKKIKFFFFNLCLFYAKFMLIYVKIIKKILKNFLIYVNSMKFHFNLC
jgi:hypothetical protein